MLFLDGQRLNLSKDTFGNTGKTYLDILKSEFPEINNNVNVTLMISDKYAKQVTGQTSEGRGIATKVYPTKTKKLKRDFYDENGERHTILWQNSMPSKKDGEYVFTNTLQDCLTIGGERPSVALNIPQDVEMLAFLYFFDPEFEGGKATDPHQACLRVVNELKEAERILKTDEVLDKAKAEIRTANIDKLSAIYENVYGRSVPAGANEVTLRAGLINSIDKNVEIRERVVSIWKAQESGGSSLDTGLVSDLIGAGLIYGNDASPDKVFYIDKKGTEQVLCQTGVEDLEGIATFLNKNVNMRTMLSKKLTEFAS
jgi:hypothetical protein